MRGDESLAREDIFEVLKYTKEIGTYYNTGHLRVQIYIGIVFRLYMNSSHIHR